MREVNGREVNEPRVKGNNCQPRSKVRSGNYTPLTLQTLVLKQERENKLQKHKERFMEQMFHRSKYTKMKNTMKMEMNADISIEYNQGIEENLIRKTHKKNT